MRLISSITGAKRGLTVASILFCVWTTITTGKPPLSSRRFAFCLRQTIMLVIILVSTISAQPWPVSKCPTVARLIHKIGKAKELPRYVRPGICSSKFSSVWHSKRFQTATLLQWRLATRFHWFTRTKPNLRYNAFSRWKGPKRQLRVLSNTIWKNGIPDLKARNTPCHVIFWEHNTWP